MLFKRNVSGLQRAIQIVLIAWGIVYAEGSCDADHLDYSGTCVDLRWCRYKLYLDARQWTEAKGICEQEGRRLLHITDQSQHNYITSFLATSLPAISASTGSPNMWIGLYQTSGGTPRWQDDCETIQAGYNPVTGNDGNEHCFVLNSGLAVYGSDACAASKQFICEDTLIDRTNCYAAAPTIFDASLDAFNYGASSSTDCHPFCTESSCVGFRMQVGTICNILTYAQGSTYTKGGTTKYSKVMIVTSSVMIADQNTILAINDICSAAVVPTTTIIPTSTSSAFETSSSSLRETSSVLERSSSVSSSQQSSTSTISPGTSSVNTASTSSNTNIESSMTSVAQSDQTSSVATPQLSTVVRSTGTAVLTAGPTTNLYTSGLSSSTCYHCYCNSNQITSMSPDELESQIEVLKKELTVEKKELSSWKRKLISVPDDRVSAKSLGYLGAGMLAVVFGAIVIIDLPRFIRGTKSFLQATCGNANGRRVNNIS